MLPLIGAIALVILAAVNSFDSFDNDRTLDRLTGDLREAIATADSIETALEDFERHQEAFADTGLTVDAAQSRLALQLVLSRFGQLREQVGDQKAEVSRLVATRADVAKLDPQRLDTAALSALHADLSAFRSAGRAGIRALREDGERGRLVHLYRSLAAIVLAFVGGGVAIAGLSRARRRAETALAQTSLELVEAERDNRRTSGLMRQLGEAATVMIYARNRDLGMAYANPTALAVVGRTWEEIAGRHGEALAYSRPTVREHEISDRQVMETGEPMTFVRETRFASDGVERFIRYTKFPLRDPQGGTVGMAAIGIDITEAVVARRQLAASEAKFRSIAHAMPALVWSMTPDGQYEFFNDNWYAFTGLPREPVGHDVWERMVHPDDYAASEAAFLRAYEAKADFEVEYRLRRQDGAYRWILARTVVVRDPTGAVERWMGTCTDVQELHETRQAMQVREAHLQSILDSVPDPMVVIDEKAVIQSFSAAAEKQFGWTAAEVVGGDVKRLMPAAYRDGHGSFVEHYLATGERKVIGIGRVVIGERKDGSTFPMELSVGEARSGDRRFFTGFVRDLSERQAAQRRFQEVQSELTHVSRLSAMGEMASALAHELNQPLAATANYIQGSVRLIDQTPADLGLIREALELASDQTVRAGAIIRRLRDFVTKGETEQRAEDLAPMLEEAGALAMLVAKNLGVRLTYQITARFHSVMVDKVQIQQVVLNLMRNAIEAMADSPVRDLTVSAEDAPEGMVRVSIRDTGTGLSDEIAAHLFEPFHTTKRDGMGVGLSISRTIIESHGGRIWAEPNAPCGTAFHFTLRAVRETDTEELQDV